MLHFAHRGVYNSELFYGAYRIGRPYLYMLKSLFFGLIAVLVFSCSSNDLNNSNKTIFNYNEMNGVSSLDPAAASNFENIWPVNQLFNGLLQMDDSLNILPAIAKSYSLSSDGLCYTFLLRNDVYFHDNECFENGKGRKVNAKDFVFSFNRLYDTKVSSASSLLDKIDKSNKANFSGFVAKNDSVFQVYLKEPFSAFINILTMKYFSVLPYEAIDYYKQDFRRNPVGTGPFIFKEWYEGSKLILLKNKKYFERDERNQSLPYLDAVTISFIKDRETAFMELLNGKFDMLSGADAFNTNEVLDKEARLRSEYQAKFNLQKETFLKTDYIGILVDETLPIVQNSAIKLKKVRQAINYAFDRTKLVKYLRNNIGVPAQSGFIAQGMKSYNVDSVVGYSYNIDKVNLLLKEAGFTNGRGLPELTLHITDNYKEQAEFIQSQLAECNIPIQLSIEKTTVLRQAVNNCEYLLFKKSWVADYADEENFMSLFYSKNFTPQGVNFFHFKNSNFDQLYEAAQLETNSSKKMTYYHQMERILIDEAPVIPLYYDQIVRLVSKKIVGLKTNPMNLLNLKSVKKTNN